MTISDAARDAARDAAWAAARDAQSRGLENRIVTRARDALQMEDVR